MANEQHPLMGALGLCRKAGKLLHGYDRVQEERPARQGMHWCCWPADASEAHRASICKEACWGHRCL